MNFKGFSPSFTLLWRITAAVAALLFVFTILLMVKDRNKTDAGFTGYISGGDSMVYLHSQPSESSRTVAILNPGTELFVDKSTTRDEISWYHVKTGNGTGWIQEINFSLTEP